MKTNKVIQQLLRLLKWLGVEVELKLSLDIAGVLVFGLNLDDYREPPLDLTKPDEAIQGIDNAIEAGKAAKDE